MLRTVWILDTVNNFDPFNFSLVFVDDLQLLFHFSTKIYGISFMLNRRKFATRIKWGLVNSKFTKNNIFQDSVLI